MSEAERAAALADEIETLSPIIAFQTMGKERRDAAEALIVRALRLLADQGNIPSKQGNGGSSLPTSLRESVAREMATRAGLHPDSMVAPPQTMLSPRDPYPIWAEWAHLVDEVVSVIEANGYVVVPCEPTPIMLQAAWRAFRGDRKGPLLESAGPAFREAISAAIATGASDHA